MPCTTTEPPSASVLAALQQRGHYCRLLRDTCLFNGTLVPVNQDDGTVQFAKTFAVRDPYDSHKEHMLARYHKLRAPAPGSAAAEILRRKVARGLSDCELPLVWLPVWALNFAEQLINSAVQLHELEAVGAYSRKSVLLRPDVDSFPCATPAKRAPHTYTRAHAVTLCVCTRWCDALTHVPHVALPCSAGGGSYLLRSVRRNASNPGMRTPSQRVCFIGRSSHLTLAPCASNSAHYVWSRRAHRRDVELL